MRFIVSRRIYCWCVGLTVVWCAILCGLTWMHAMMQHPHIPVDDDLAVRILNGHVDTISGLRFAPDGNRLVSTSWDDTTRIWDVGSGHEICTLTGHKGGVSTLALYPDPPIAVTGDRDSGIILWDIRSCQKKASTARPSFIHSLAFDPDGGKVLVAIHGGGRHSLFAWNYHTSDHDVLPGEWFDVVSATVPTLGRIIITAGEDGSVVIWDESFTKRLKELPLRHRSGASFSLVSRNNRLAVYWPADNIGVVWDLEAWQQICEFRSSLMNTVSSVCLSPGGSLLVLTGCVWSHEPGAIELFHATSGRLMCSLRAHQSIAYSAAISPDEHQLATGGGLDHSIKIWSLQALLQNPENK
jgi:WD40 repeat protein